MALRCVDCDRWDLREAVLVDEDGMVLLRGNACPHCHRHRADDEDRYSHGRYSADQVGSRRYRGYREDRFAEDRFSSFADDPFDERGTFAFRG
jgi:hypothetical protein